MRVRKARAWITHIGIGAEAPGIDATAEVEEVKLPVAPEVACTAGTSVMSK